MDPHITCVLLDVIVSLLLPGLCFSLVQYVRDESREGQDGSQVMVMVR